MFGGLMIANFRYDPSPAADDVVVELYWDHGKRMGKIVVPPEMNVGIDDHQLPRLEPLPVISAVAYAMVLAAQAHRHLRLSGDEDVWPTEWGSLVRSH